MKSFDVRRTALMGVLAGAVALQGCGDTCTSKAADIAVSDQGSCGSLAANTAVTITVPVNQSCGESSGTCVVEMVNGALELSPSFQECQGNSSCGTRATTGTVDCLIPASDAVGVVPVTVIGDGNTNTVTVNFGQGPASCAFGRSTALRAPPAPTP